MNLQIYGFNLQGGQYKQMIEKNLGNFCDFFYSDAHKDMYDDVITHYEPFVPFGTCPFPKGQYTVKNYRLKGVEDMIPPYVPGSEKWKAIAEFQLNGTRLGGMTFYGTLINDKNVGVRVG